jgi:CheY-like chemotaxis protein
VDKLTTDPRKSRPLKLPALQVLVADANPFNRSLLGDILRNLGVSRIALARDSETAHRVFADRQIDVVLLGWDEGDMFDAPGFCRALRRHRDERLRKLPAVLVTASLTRQLVIAGRDAGIDEFLARPISPTALKQRFEMVVETPRPFVASDIYVGPCRRRKNPADYHGARRRAGDTTVRAPLVDQDDVARQAPMRVSLTKLRETCKALCAGTEGALEIALSHLRMARSLATAQGDTALHAGLAAFESWLSLAVPHIRIDTGAMNAALNALDQFAALPPTFADARGSVANALNEAIKQKVA